MLLRPLAGYNYTLRDLGDGFAMLDGSVNVVDYVMEDYMVLSNYVKGFDNGVIEAKNSPLLEKYPNMLIDYAKLNGSGRIVIAKRSDDTSSDTSSDSGKTESGTSSGVNSNTNSGNNNSDTSPKTGDDRNLWLLFSLIFVSGAGVFVITLNRCKKLEKQ